MSPTVPQASLHGVSHSIPFPAALPSAKEGTLQQRGLGEEAFVILLVGKRQEIAMGSRAFKGFLLSICCPALSAAPISLCLGTAAGSCAGHVSGRSPGHLLLGQRVLYSKMVAPGAFPGDSPAEEIAAVQRAPHQCHGMPWPWGSPSLSAGLGSSLDKPLELCLQYPRLACWRIAPVCGNDALPILVLLPPSLLLFLIVILA